MDRELDWYLHILAQPDRLNLPCDTREESGTTSIIVNILYSFSIYILLEWFNDELHEQGLLRVGVVVRIIIMSVVSFVATVERLWNMMLHLQVI